MTYELQWHIAKNFITMGHVVKSDEEDYPMFFPINKFVSKVASHQGITDEDLKKDIIKKIWPKDSLTGVQIGFRKSDVEP
jgi:hypothetical protein